MAIDDDSLASAIIALVCAAEISSRELGAPEIGARIFEIVDLAADRIRAVARSKDRQDLVRLARIRTRTGALSEPRRAPFQGERPTEGSIRLASLRPPRSFR
jgi:hypothetical protein